MENENTSKKKGGVLVAVGAILLALTFGEALIY